MRSGEGREERREEGINWDSRLQTRVVSWEDDSRSIPGAFQAEEAPEAMID